MDEPGLMQRLSPLETKGRSLRRTLLILIFTLLVIPNWTSASSSKFGTCGHWLESKPHRVLEESDKDDLLKHSYRIGAAHGFVYGLGGSLHGYYGGPGTITDPPRESLRDFYAGGLVQVLMRPALMMDAWDQKCSDFRNRSLALDDLGFLIMLEIGGMKANKSEEAMRLLRIGGTRVRVDVIRALTQ